MAVDNMRIVDLKVLIIKIIFYVITSRCPKCESDSETKLTAYNDVTCKFQALVILCKYDLP